MDKSRRKHQRMATAFLNTPVTLRPFDPLFAKAVQGRMIDLSAGGMALLIGEQIPLGTRLHLTIQFPDKSKLETTILVKHVSPREGAYLHGLEFLSIPSYMSDKIESMSMDYIDCENRINQNEKEVCRTDCRFFSMCTKAERYNPVFDADVALELAFQSLQKSTLNL